MSWYLALALAASGTYAVRVASIHAFGRRDLPARTERGLQLAALAVLAALSVSSVPIAPGESLPSVAVGSAVVAAIVAARHIRNIAVIPAIAMATHMIVETVLG
jgi:branched-subunit amino acid transport protein